MHRRGHRGTPASRRRRAARRRRSRAAWIAAAAVLLAAVLAVGLSQATASPEIPRGAARVDVSSRPYGRPIPRDDIGLSIEFRSVLPYAGTDAAHPDPVFIALMRQLDPGGAPVLRIGGDTTDWTWWQTPGVTEPGGVRYTIGPRWTRGLGALARALPARLVLGINFEADSAAIARTESRRLLQIIGRPPIAGFELGNEPEVYGTLGWYADPSGRPVFGRPASYGFGAYLHDEARVQRELPASVPVVGPASGAPAWLTGLPQYLRANPRVAMVTFHRYPLHRCFTARNSPDYPSIPNLLAPVASSGPADSLAPAIAVAHAAGRRFRVDELNSVSCGGARGISDTFASSLWILDTLFHMAAVGADGVNIHTFQKAVYEPFGISHRGGRFSAAVRPLYYGLLTFARAAPAGARLLAVSIAPKPASRTRTPASTARPAQLPPRAPDLREWATTGPDHRVRVLVINDSLRRRALLAIRVPASAQTATVERLLAPRVNARRGLTLAGQSFGPRTTSGMLTGTPRRIPLSAIRGRFVLRVPPASAALLIVPHSQAR